MQKKLDTLEKDKQEVKYNGITEVQEDGESRKADTSNQKEASQKEPENRSENDQSNKLEPKGRKSLKKGLQ